MSEGTPQPPFDDLAGTVPGADQLDDELATMLGKNPQLQSEARKAVLSNRVHLEIQESLQSSDPATAHAVELGRDLYLYIDELDVAALSSVEQIYTSQAIEADKKVRDNVHSTFVAAIKAGIDTAAFEDVGENAFELPIDNSQDGIDPEDWLIAPSYRARSTNTDSQPQFYIEASPIESDYDKLDILVTNNGESLRYHSFDFHGQRQVRINYSLNFAQPGDEHNSSGISVNLEYTINEEGNVMNVRNARARLFGNDDKQLETLRYHKDITQSGDNVDHEQEKAFLLTKWLDARAGVLISNLDLNNADMEVTDKDYVSRVFDDDPALRRPLHELDMLGQRKALDAMGNQAK